MVAQQLLGVSMPKQTTDCPRCGYTKARPNAQGPDKIYCRKCGGLVEVNHDNRDDALFHTNPERNAMLAEDDAIAEQRGESRGVIRSGRKLKGGL